MKRRWTLNIRLFAVTILISVPIILLLLWINANNLENLRKEKVAQSLAEVSSEVSQLDTMMELLEISLVNMTLNNPDFRIVAEGTQQTTDYWRANQRIINKMKNLNNASTFQFHIFAYYPKSDLFINSMVEPPMTSLLKTMIDNKEEVPLKNRWNTVWCDGRAYAIRVIEYEDYCIGAWMTYNNLLYKLAVTNSDGSRYYFTDEQGLTLNSGTTETIDTLHTSFRDENDRVWYNAYVPSTRADFKFVKLISADSLEAERAGAINNIFWVTVALVGLFVIFIMGIYRWVISPINHMRKSMAVIEAGDLQYRIPKPDNLSAEIENVIDQFNTMMDQLEQMKIEIYEGKLESQETKLQYLGQQIQPHFILNTLNTLYNYCDRDQKATKEIILLLTRYYRHVVNINSKYVSLGQELEHIDNYLKLQKVRFPNAFDYEVHCESPYEIIPVPPFIIESFVINAMKYGMVTGAATMIRIDVSKVDQFTIRIRISDTGNGFSEDVLDSIQDFIERGIVSEELGVGNRNAIERLRLIYADKSKIIFYNQQPHGAVVEMEMALQSNKEVRNGH